MEYNLNFMWVFFRLILLFFLLLLFLQIILPFHKFFCGACTLKELKWDVLHSIWNVAVL